MQILTDIEFQSEAEPLFRQVFTGSDPTVTPFTSTVSARRILYPCFFDFEEAIPSKAIVRAAKTIGDTACYITKTIRSFEEPNHCYIPLSEFEAGYAGQPGSTNLIGVRLKMDVYGMYITIFSASGRWGLMLVEEGLALLGGTSEFVEALQANVPTLDKQVYAYLQDLKQSKLAGMRLTIDWLPGLLSHIYGDETGEKLLREVEIL